MANINIAKAVTKDLLFSVTKKDLNITYFSGKGGGGQHRNRHMNCVRLNHKDSGAIVTGQSNKERLSNVKEALSNLTDNAKFKVWHARKVLEVLRGKTIKDLVEEMMDPSNIQIEGKNEKGQWECLKK